MAYERYETRRGRYGDFDRERARRDERGFFERAGDEIASWFGDEEAERRRREDERMGRGWGGERDRDRDRYNIGGRGERDLDRDRFGYRGSRREWDRGRFEDEDRGYRGYAGYERDFSPRGYGARGVDRGHEPAFIGGYGYSGGYGGYGYGAGTERGYGSSGYGRFGEDFERERGETGRSRSGTWRDYDRDYQAWRQRQLDELDRDYDEYRMENRERFERDFGTWRQKRQQKRGMLGHIREHMDVVGSDGETLGKVDCVRGDRIILTKDDSPDNRHHSISCGMIETVEGDQIRLEVPAEEAKSRWRDEEDSGLFGRGREEKDVNLERSFAGTYR